MPRATVTTSEIHSMDMGLKSTGFMMPDEVEVAEEIYHGVRCWIEHIDHLFGKLIPGQTISVSGMPGAGKTTLFLQLLSKIAEGCPEDIEVEADDGVDLDEKSVAYVSCEERIDFLKLKSQRLDIDNVALCNEAYVETIAEYIESGQFDVMVIDSLQGLNSKLVEGERKVTQYAGNKIVQAAQKSNTIVFVICHSTVQGKIKGGTKFPHQVDCDLRISRASGYGKDTRMIYTEKNRMGQTGEVYLDMNPSGYDLYNPSAPSDDDEEDEGDSRAVRKENDMRTICDAIEEDSYLDMNSLGQMCKDTGIDLGRAERLLKELTSMGDVVRTGTRRHNFKWSLTE